MNRVKNTKVFRIAIMASIATGILFLSQCKPEDKPMIPDPYQDEPYTLTVPKGFPPPVLSTSNPLTVHGVELGRKLFYDPILSGDNTQSCASCHNQATSFTDAPNKFSKGIDGIVGNKNSMAIINMAWNRDFFWDGRSTSLEKQTLEPVSNPIEMHESWSNAIKKLQADTSYTNLFKKAFGTDKADSTLAARAMAQFMKTIVVSESKFQKFLRKETLLTDAERRGYAVFISEEAGDCFHCHMVYDALFTDNYVSDPVQRFHNNGLDPEPAAGIFTGRALITNNPADIGKFKTPTLLNVALTPPYMHDGRFNTLEEVVEFYNSGVHASRTLDVNMNIKPQASNRTFENGVRNLHLSQQQKDDLVAFLKTLTDPTIATNPAYSKP